MNKKKLFKKQIDFENQAEILSVFGEFDKNLRKIEKENDVIINARGNIVVISGDEKKVEKAADQLMNMKEQDKTKEDIALDGEFLSVLRY